MILIPIQEMPYFKFETLPDFQFFNTRYPLHSQDWNFRSDGKSLNLPRGHPAEGIPV